MDFVAFHAKGQPSLVEGNVRLAIGNHLNNVSNGFRTIAAFPELKSVPIVIGESDPDTCAACRAIEYPQNAYRNRPHFASYTAASYARKYDLADQHGVNLEGILAWTFQFDDQPFFAGLRALATNGIDLPVMNTFRMFAKMSGDRIATDSSHGYALEEITQRGRRGAGGAEPAADGGRGRGRGGRGGVRGEPDVAAMASLDGNKLAAIVWHYHDDDIAGEAAAITLAFSGLPQRSGQARLLHYRIDDEHSNSFSVWQKMGSPQQPTPEQYAELERAGKLAQLAGPPTNVAIENGQANLKFNLPRQGVSLVVLEMNAN
jgi:xylan 1,4-beta-xylosidase